MANKRFLKKQIKMICGDMAAECITAAHLIPGTDKKKLRDCVIEVAKLQASTLNNVNIVFDKTPRDFTSGKEYKAAKRAYYAAAYKSLKTKFNKHVDTVLHEMNSSLPKKD